MRAIFAAAIVATALAAAAPASANVVYSLSGMTLTGGGTLTGSFTLNDSLTSVLSANITASPLGSYTGHAYTYPGSTLNQSLPTQYFQLDSANSAFSLRFAFSSLTATSATLNNTASYEYESVAGSRTVSGGRVVVAAPEPASVAVLGAGLLGLAGIGFRRSRRG
jgi:hypothetical protein